MQSLCLPNSHKAQNNDSPQMQVDIYAVYHDIPGAAEYTANMEVPPAKH